MFIVLHAKRILCIIGLTILFLGGMMIISYRTLVPVLGRRQQTLLCQWSTLSTLAMAAKMDAPFRLPV